MGNSHQNNPLVSAKQFSTRVHTLFYIYSGLSIVRYLNKDWVWFLHNVMYCYHCITCYLGCISIIYFYLANLNISNSYQVMRWLIPWRCDHQAINSMVSNVLPVYNLDSGDAESFTHWGRVTHICVSKLITIGSDNGLSPGRRQAIIWTNAGKLLIRPLGTNFSEILIEIHKFPLKKMHLKTSSAKWRPFCLGLNVLNPVPILPSWLTHAVTHW